MRYRWLVALVFCAAFLPWHQGLEALRDFYKLFYQIDLTAEQIEALLTSATPSKQER